MRGGAFFNGKEGRADFRKTDIRSRFSEPMQVCIANNLMISKMLQISWNLQQS